MLLNSVLKCGILECAWITVLRWLRFDRLFSLLLEVWKRKHVWHNPKYNTSYCTFIKGESTKAQASKKAQWLVCLCFPNKGHVISYQGNFPFSLYLFLFNYVRVIGLRRGVMWFISLVRRPRGINHITTTLARIPQGMQKYIDEKCLYCSSFFCFFFNTTCRHWWHSGTSFSAF